MTAAPAALPNWLRLRVQVDRQRFGAGQRPCIVIQVQLFGPLQGHVPMSRTDSLASKMSKCVVKISQHRRPGIENVEVETELLVLRDGPAVQRAGAQNERARPIAESAGRWPELAPRFEQAGVRGRRGGIAQNSSQCAANDVAAFSGGKMDWFQGPEMESKPKELEFALQNPPRSPAIMVWHLTLVFRFVTD